MHHDFALAQQTPTYLFFHNHDFDLPGLSPEDSKQLVTACADWAEDDSERLYSLAYSEDPRQMPDCRRLLNYLAEQDIRLAAQPHLIPDQSSLQQALKFAHLLAECRAASIDPDLAGPRRPDFGADDWPGTYLRNRRLQATLLLDNSAGRLL